MSYRLAIAEKPSVAQSIAAVLGADVKKEGFLEGNGWRVSWCLGHLIGLADATAYDPSYQKWRAKDLPIIPAPWKLEILPSKGAQYHLLCKLMNAEDVSEIVNCCDAGREGELIFRHVYEMAGCRKPVKRLWISSLEESAIQKGFETLQPQEDYDGLYHAAVCRAQADWLVGINATRLFSVLYNHTLKIGRVMSPTLAMLVERESQIAAFEPEPFYTVQLKLPDFTVTGERLKNRADAEQILSACTGSDAVITKVVRRERKVMPPALYDLTTLQRDANKQFGFTAQQVLDYVQELYEEKLCTYPRTDSRYITDDMASDMTDLAKSVMDCCHLKMSSPVFHTKQIVNNAKVTDHHAILPTLKLDHARLNALPEGKRKLMDLICRRFLSAMDLPHLFSEKTVTATCGGYTFQAKGKTVLIPGWQQIAALPEEEDSEKLPDVSEGQSFPVSDGEIKEGQTTPPRHYTEDTLLGAMERAGEEDMPESAERSGLGTPATRAGILEKLVATGYMTRQKAKKAVHLIPSEKAFHLIAVLPEQLQSPLLTADWETQLSQIAQGALSSREFMDAITTMVSDLVSNYAVPPGTEYLFCESPEIVGTCPRCGANIAYSQKNYHCENKNCSFAIWENNRWWSMKGKKLTKKIVAELLKNGHASVKGFRSSKTGKTYDADVILEDTGTFVNFRLDFGEGGST